MDDAPHTAPRGPVAPLRVVEVRDAFRKDPFKVAIYPVGALRCPRCGWRSTYQAKLNVDGSNSYFCPPCSRAGRTTALEVADAA